VLLGCGTEELARNDCRLRPPAFAGCLDGLLAHLARSGLETAPSRTAGRPESPAGIVFTAMFNQDLP